ncbi:MAG: dockerin type I domain-containing protein [Pirellula sp.]
MAFIDLNRDSRHSLGEPIAITNTDGIASFSGVEPGVYSIRLLGSNRSIEQTTPVRPGLFSNQLDVPVSQFVDWSSNGDLLWGVDGSRILGIDSVTGLQAESVEFDGGVREVATCKTSEGALSGFALIDSEQGLAIAPFETGMETGFASSIPLNGVHLSSLTNIGSRFVAWNNVDQEVVELKSDDGEVSLTSLGLPTHGRFIGLRPVAESRIAVLEMVANRQRLSVYDLMESGLLPVAHRFLINTVRDWSVSADGDLIYIDQGAGIEVFEIGFGVQNVASLPGARWPLLEDAERGILYTGSRENTNAIDMWEIQNWKKSSSTPIDVDVKTAGLFLSHDASELHALKDSRLVSRELLTAGAVEAEIGTAQRLVSIGIRSVGQNTAPQVEFGTNLMLDEDTIASLGNNLLQSMAIDRDSDPIYWVVVSQPFKGTLEWSAEVGGFYSPMANENGSDSLRIAAFDGASWSAPIQVPVFIAPVNDAPSDLRLSANGIDENIGPDHLVTTVFVVDPDQYDQYDVTVSDGRFRFIENKLVLVEGLIDFEVEPFIPIFITAVNRSVPTDRFSKMVTLNVVDRNDPPRGLNVDDLSIAEMKSGNVLGRLRVDDQDSVYDYDWTVDDPRFEVVDGKLILKDGYQLDYEIESFVSLSMRATDRNSGWTVEQTVSVSVIDQNDAPVGILAAAGYDVPEDTPGIVAGFVYVDDPDYGEEYIISVSDSRFEVVDNALKLIDGTSLAWEEPGYVDVTLTAVSLRNGTVLTKSTRIHIVKDATPYHNDQDPADVDGNGMITPIDALVIVNYINNHGPGVIKPEGEGPVPNLDVDGDGMVTPIDILIIINIINGNSNSQDYITVDPDKDVPEKGESEPSEQVELEPAIATLGTATDIEEPRRRRR